MAAAVEALKAMGEVLKGSRKRVEEAKANRTLKFLPFNVPTFDWATGGGLARGRIMELFGLEGTGKCIAGSTEIGIPGVGVSTVGEALAGLPWRRRKGRIVANQTVQASLPVAGAYGPTLAVSAYYAGRKPTVRIATEDGHDQSCSPIHHYLVLRGGGVASWVAAGDLVPGDLSFSTGGHGLAPDWYPASYVGGWFCADPAEPESLGLLGALASSCLRDGRLWVATSTAGQRARLFRWAEKCGASDIFESFPAWRSFTGLVRIAGGRAARLCEFARSEAARRFVCRLPLRAQRDWATGLTLTAGEWTGGDLEFELVSEHSARCLQTVLENLGIRCRRWRTVSAAGTLRWKVSLRSEEDHLLCSARLWDGHELPSPWRGRTASRESLPEQGMEVVRRLDALVASVREGVDGPAPLDGEYDPDEVAEAVGWAESRIRTRDGRAVMASARLLSDQHIRLDRIVDVSPGPDEDLWDIHVPCGSHFAAGSLVSHNSTIALDLANQTLSADPGATVVYADVEHSLPDEYVKTIVAPANMSRFFWIQPTLFEDLDQAMMELWNRKSVPTLTVLDSVASLIPEEDWERDRERDDDGNTKQGRPGGLARVIGPFVNQWTKMLTKENASMLLINQVRSKFGQKFGGKLREEEQYTTPGGFAVRFHCSQRIYLRVVKKIQDLRMNPMLGKEQQLPVASVIEFRCVKNKVDMPFRSGIGYLVYGVGIDRLQTLTELAVAQDIVSQGGSWYRLVGEDGSEWKANGKDAFKALLEQNPEARVRLESLLRIHEADQIFSQSLGRSEVNVDTGEVVMEATESAIEKAREAMTVVEAAVAIGSISKSGKYYRWSGQSGDELRATSPRALWGKMGPEDRKEAINVVAAALGEDPEAYSSRMTALVSLPSQADSEESGKSQEGD
jgi:RecA/RadA recombinase